jgi:hypothetical protein
MFAANESIVGLASRVLNGDDVSRANSSRNTNR